MVKLLAAVLVLSSLASLAAEPKKNCSLVTIEDASAILGSVASHQPAERDSNQQSSCMWADAAQKKFLNVFDMKNPKVPDRTHLSFEQYRTLNAKSGTTEEEKGLGGPAFSYVPSRTKGNIAVIYCLKGNTILVMTLDATGAQDRLPQMRDVMRKLVSKL